jgi:probable HAF family extracellular repeat protein
MSTKLNLRGKLLAISVVLLVAIGQTQSIRWLGTLGGFNSRALDISADGRVCVGWSEVTSGRIHAFRWSLGFGLQDLGTLPGYPSSVASGVSADGQVIVGWSEYSALVSRAFRWTAVSGLQSLGTLGGSWSEAYAVSPDGQVVVGDSATTAMIGHAFRWSQSAGMRDLGTLGGNWSGARGISADGGTVVGYADNLDGEYHASRWWPDNTVQDLDTLGGRGSQALATSSDGNIVVGWSYNEAELQRAFICGPNGDIQPLPILPNSYSTVAHDVSGDGSVIVGSTSLLSGGAARALRWKQGIGVENLNTSYASLLTDGSLLVEATAITPDGRYIAGWGIRGGTSGFQAFRLDTWREGDVDGDGCVDDADLLSVLFAFGTPGTGLRYEDISQDGIVDDADLLIVLFNYGSGC